MREIVKQVITREDFLWGCIMGLTFTIACKMAPFFQLPFVAVFLWWGLGIYMIAARLELKTTHWWAGVIVSAITTQLLWQLCIPTLEAVFSSLSASTMKFFL